MLRVLSQATHGPSRCYYMELLTDGASGEELLAARTSASHVVKHIIRATAGFAVAYVGARLTIDWLRDESTLDAGHLLVEVPIHLGLAGFALTLTSALPIVKDLLDVKRLVTTNERELAERAVGQQFLRNVHDAFEMVENEGELFRISGRALGELAHSEAGGSEVLIADSSGAHVQQAIVADVGTAPACGVLTPGSCPAVRRGQTLKFADPNGLATCPRLRERNLADGMGATCIPITILGTPSAVMHSTYDFIESNFEYEKKVDTLEGVALQLGARLGMLRAMSQSQLQAETDPLTGLRNRRALENDVRELRSNGRNFAIAMLDLDNFKRLNDTFGHDTGDRALRLFARVMSETVRDHDILCRHGGEEFVVVLPGADVASAAAVFHRLRERLAEAVAGSQVPPFTVSIGLCDSSWSNDLQDLLRSADRALMLAKAEGRDRLIIDDPTLDAPAEDFGRRPIPNDLPDDLSGMITTSADIA